MKMASCILGYLIVIVLAITSANQSSIDAANLSPQECLEQFPIDKYIPLNEILKDIFIAYRYDPEVKEVFEHLVSSEFKSKMEKLQKSEEYQKIRQLFEERELKTFEAINLFKTMLPILARQAENILVQDAQAEEMTGGVHGLLMRIFERRISLEGIRQSLACNAKYMENIQVFLSPKFKDLFERLRDTEEYKNVVADLEGHKIYLDVYFNKILEYLNIEN